jgi:hypothetical protein
MIALADGFPSPRAEMNEDPSDKVESPNSPTVSFSVDRQQSPAERTSTAGDVRGAISRIFREAMRCLTRKAPAPEPRRRRRSEDTWTGFRKAARNVVRRIAALPAIAYFAALLADNPLDPLNPYWDPQAGNDDLTGDIHNSQQNDLSPHP